MRPYLQIDKAPGVGMRRLLVGEMKAALAELEGGLVDGGIPKENVHWFRKRSKRLRALFRLAEPVLGDAYERENAMIRDMARELGGSRDRAVMADTLCVLNVATEGEARRVPVPVPGRESIVAMAQTLKAGIRRMKQRDFSRLDGKALRDSFFKTYRRVLREWKGVRSEPCDERLHALRRWAYYYRYQLNVLEKCQPKKIRRIERRLGKLVEAIGKAHDLQVLRGHLTPHRELGALSRRIDEAELGRLETAFRIASRLFDLPHGALPKGLKTRLKRWGKVRH